MRLSTESGERTSTWTSPGATNTWQVELRNTAGATQATLLGTQTETGLESSWSGDLSGSDQAVPTSLQASNSTVRLAIVANQSLANHNGADVAFRWDHVSLAITYIPTNRYGYDKLYRLTSVNNPATT